MVAMVAGLVGLSSLSPVVAQQTPNATRSFDSATVTPGGELVVTITAVDYGQAGGVTETLPSGFSYESSTLPANQVLASGQEVRFTVFGPEDSPFRYTVTASSVPGTYAFSGMLRDSDRVDHTVGGGLKRHRGGCHHRPNPHREQSLVRFISGAWRGVGSNDHCCRLRAGRGRHRNAALRVQL